MQNERIKEPFEKLVLFKKIMKTKGKRTRYFVEIPRKMIEALDIDFKNDYRIEITKVKYVVNRNVDK